FLLSLLASLFPYTTPFRSNHSATQYPDIFNAKINGKPAAEVINDQAWLEDDFIPTVAKRGAAIIEARGASSAASAANATIDHMQDRKSTRLNSSHVKISYA